jgi:hypothetical protein
VIIRKFELGILQINFYSGLERLVGVGETDSWVGDFGGRIETFEIAEDEQLIGCILD